MYVQTIRTIKARVELQHAAWCTCKCYYEHVHVTYSFLYASAIAIASPLLPDGLSRLLETPLNDWKTDRSVFVIQLDDSEIDIMWYIRLERFI